MNDLQTIDDFLECIDKNTNTSVWLVDAINIFRVSIQKTQEGSLTQIPINGTATIFDVISGTLYLNLIPASFWEGKQNRVRSVPQISADAISTALGLRSKDEQPKAIIRMSSTMHPTSFESLEPAYPNIIFTTMRNLYLPLGSFAKLEMISNLMRNATEVKLVEVNIYDDWLQTIPPRSAFSRLMLFLQGLHVDKEKTTNLIFSKPVENGRCFPTLTHEEWIDIEVKLLDHICEKAKIHFSESPITESEKLRYIFGAKDL